MSDLFKPNFDRYSMERLAHPLAACNTLAENGWVAVGHNENTLFLKPGQNIGLMFTELGSWYPVEITELSEEQRLARTVDEVLQPHVLDRTDAGIKIHADQGEQTNG